jgi:hypothetical protein
MASCQIIDAFSTVNFVFALAVDGFIVLSFSRIFFTAVVVAAAEVIATDVVTLLLPQ